MRICGRRSSARLARELYLRLEDIPGKGDDRDEHEVVQRVAVWAQVGRRRASREGGRFLDK